MFIYVPPDAKTIIKNEVPLKLRSKFVNCVQLGYKLASSSLKQVPILNWDLGESHEGYLRRIAVHYAFKKAIDDGELPFTYSYEYTKYKRHHYMVIHTNNAKITLSQVKHRETTGRHAFYRDKLQEANQLTMIFNGNENVMLDLNKDIYLLLTFSSGGEDPLFINLGMPNSNGWIDKINLLTEPRIIKMERNQDEEEVINEEQLVGFRKYIEEVEEGGN